MQDEQTLNPNHTASTVAKSLFYFNFTLNSTNKLGLFSQKDSITMMFSMPLHYLPAGIYIHVQL